MDITMDDKKIENHETVKVAIKEYDIDKNMVKVVKYLNKLPSVITLYCCQGDDSINKPSGQPYIMFHCSDFDVLQFIMRHMSAYGNMQVKYRKNSVYYNSVSYCFRFKSEEDLKQYKKRIKKIEFFK